MLEDIQHTLNRLTDRTNSTLGILQQARNYFNNQASAAEFTGIFSWVLLQQIFICLILLCTLQSEVPHREERTKKKLKVTVKYIISNSVIKNKKQSCIFSSATDSYILPL